MLKLVAPGGGMSTIRTQGGAAGLQAIKTTDGRTIILTSKSSIQPSASGTQKVMIVSSASSQPTVVSAPSTAPDALGQNAEAGESSAVQPPPVISTAGTTYTTPNASDVSKGSQRRLMRRHQKMVQFLSF